MSETGNGQRRRGQRGIAKNTVELLDRAKTIIEEVEPITVRGVCYRLFVEGLIPSMGKKYTAKISRLLVRAREQGIIPWEWIVDESRSLESEPSWLDIKQYADVVKRSYRKDYWRYQERKVIIISEKATVSGILRPVLEEYGVPFMALHGFNSATKVHELAAESAADERMHVFLYVGDYDCSGMHMSEKDLPQRLGKYGANAFEFRRIALIDDDLDDLPSFEAKEFDPRYRWYVEMFGEEAWELDAMNPNVLRKRVADSLGEYIDTVSWAQCKVVEAAEQETVRKIAARMNAARIEA